MTSQSIEFAKYFIKAYYPVMVYQPNELVKFYIESAIICRPEFNSPEGLPIAKCINDLPIKLTPDSQFAIASYTVNQFMNFAHISVQGTIITENNVSMFTQDFVIQQIMNRFFIVSDKFDIVIPENIINNAKQSVAIQSRQVNQFPNQPNQPPKADYPQQPQFTPNQQGFGAAYSGFA